MGGIIRGDVVESTDVMVPDEDGKVPAASDTVTDDKAKEEEEEEEEEEEKEEG
jgi:hypothetical protein